MSLLAMIPGEWVLEALCSPDTAELWVDDSKIGKRERIREAKAVCRLCPVSQECYAEAVRTRQRLGVWGGVDFGSTTVQRQIKPRNPTTRDWRCGTQAGAQAHYGRNESPCERCALARRVDQRARRAKARHEEAAC